MKHGDATLGSTPPPGGRPRSARRGKSKRGASSGRDRPPPPDLRARDATGGDLRASIFSFSRRAAASGPFRGSGGRGSYTTACASRPLPLGVRIGPTSPGSAQKTEWRPERFSLIPLAASGSAAKGGSPGILGIVLEIRVEVEEAGAGKLARGPWNSGKLGKSWNREEIPGTSALRESGRAGSGARRLTEGVEARRPRCSRKPRRIREGPGRSSGRSRMLGKLDPGML
jgi:hypothetical protein